MCSDRVISFHKEGEGLVPRWEETALSTIGPLVMLEEPHLIQHVQAGSHDYRSRGEGMLGAGTGLSRMMPVLMPTVCSRVVRTTESR